VLFASAIDVINTLAAAKNAARLAFSVIWRNFGR
jgi:hypothetical protein